MSIAVHIYKNKKESLLGTLFHSIVDFIFTNQHIKHDMPQHNSRSK